MFYTLQEVDTFYNSTESAAIPMAERHARIYQEFEAKVRQHDPQLQQAFLATEGFGELAFQWNWWLAVKDAPTAFKFLEVGVYKGRVLATIQYLADRMKKSPTIVGVTPLSTEGDKYSGYDDVDYFAAIRRSYEKTGSGGVSFANTRIIKGYSQDPVTLCEAAQQGPYDIIFIDGCHDYDVVCQDISNYVALLREGGLLVMDDASLFLEAPAGRFHGHPDVAKAIRDRIDGNPALRHIYAVGHNRVWRKCPV